MKLMGNLPISIIQGDSYEYKIKFENDIDDLIEKVVITSEDLNIDSEMTFVPQKNTGHINLHLPLLTRILAIFIVMI